MHAFETVAYAIMLCLLFLVNAGASGGGCRFVAIGLVRKTKISILATGKDPLVVATLIWLLCTFVATAWGAVMLFQNEAPIWPCIVLFVPMTTLALVAIVADRLC